MASKPPRLTAGRGKSTATVRVVSETKPARLPEPPGVVLTAAKFPVEAYRHLLSGKPYIRPPQRQKPADDSGDGA